MRCNEKTFFCLESCKKNGAKLRLEIKYALLRHPAGRSRRRERLRFNPLHQKSNDGGQFLRLQLPALRDTMPAMQAAATTTRAGMLCLEHGMPAHGSLVTIPHGISRRQPLPDKILRMSANRVQPHTLYIGSIICRQPKTATESGLHQSRKRREHERKRNRRAGRALAVPKKDDVTGTINCSRGPGTCRLPS